jgi:hypothetical protein
VAIEVLIRSILGGRFLEARQWVADAHRAGVRFDRILKPTHLGRVELALAAGVMELLAEREHQAAPGWTQEVGQLAEPFYLGKLAQMPHSAEEARRNGPEPLRRRNVFALPNFLTVV